MHTLMHSKQGADCVYRLTGLRATRHVVIKRRGSGSNGGYLILFVCLGIRATPLLQRRLWNNRCSLYTPLVEAARIELASEILFTKFSPGADYDLISLLPTSIIRLRKEPAFWSWYGARQNRIHVHREGHAEVKAAILFYPTSALRQLLMFCY